MYDYVSGSYPAPEAGSQRPWQVLVGHPFKHGVASCPVGFVGGCVGVARVGVAGDVERGLRHKSQGGGVTHQGERGCICSSLCAAVVLCL